MRFEVTYPSGVRNEVELEGTSALLGRDPGCDLVLNDVKCSRRHAIIEAGPTGMVIRDNGSANGIYVNGKKVETAELKDGDQVRLGQIVVTVLGEDVAPTVAMDAEEFADIEETEPLPKVTGRPPQPELSGARTGDSTPALGMAAAGGPEPESEVARPSSAVRRPAGASETAGRAPTPPPRTGDTPSGGQARPAPAPPAQGTARPRPPASPPAPPPAPPPRPAPQPPARTRQPQPPRGASRGRATLERPVTVTLLAALWLLGVLLYAGLGVGLALSSGLSGARAAGIVVLGLAMAGVSGALGYGLWTLAPWARMAQIVTALVGALSCVFLPPSAAILAYMMRPEVPVLFSGRDRRQLDEQQSRVLAAAGSDSLWAVAILVALMVSSVMGVGSAWFAYWYYDAAGPGGPLGGS